MKSGGTGVGSKNGGPANPPSMGYNFFAPSWSKVLGVVPHQLPIHQVAQILRELVEPLLQTCGASVAS